MGFFSTVGSFISGVGNAISSGLSMMVDGLSGIGRAIGDGIKTMCETLGSEGLSLIGCIAIALIIPGFGIPEILALIQIVGQAAKALGIRGEDNPEQLGMKMEIAEKKPEDFNSTEAYIKYLSEEVKLEAGATEKLEVEEKVKYGAMGAALNIKALEEKYNISLTPDFLRDITIIKLTGDEVASYIEEFKKNDLDKMQDMTDYLREKPIEASKSTVSDSIIDTMKELYPELTSEQLRSKLAEMKEEINDFPLEVE